MTHTNRWIAGSTAIVVAAVTLLAGSLGTAYASTTEHDIGIGIATTQIYVTQGWHTPGKSLDMTNNAAPTVGSTVYSQTRKISGNDMTAYKATYTSGSGCTGVRALYKTSGGVTLGDTAYVHIAVSGSIPTSWTMGSGYTLAYMGTVLGTEPTPCGPGAGSCPNPPQAGICDAWTGPHLHQSEAVATGAGRYNSGVSGGNTYAGSTWLHHLYD
jgi:hypothetical protein